MLELLEEFEHLNCIDQDHPFHRRLLRLPYLRHADLNHLHPWECLESYHSLKIQKQRQECFGQQQVL